MNNWTAFILGLVGSLHCLGMCGPLAMAMLALLFILRGLSLGIPFVSPDLSGNTGNVPCCH